MITHVTDGQVVGETLATLFSAIQQGPVSFLITLKNAGLNTMNYRFQEFNGTAWVDMGTSGTDFYNTIAPNEVKSFKLTSAYPQVQMVGNAAGGAYLEFSITRYHNRASGGTVPVLNL